MCCVCARALFLCLFAFWEIFFFVFRFFTSLGIQPLIFEVEEDKEEEDNIAPYSFRVFLSWEQTEFCAEQFLCRTLLISLECLSRALFLMTFCGETSAVALFFCFFLAGGNQAVN